MTVAELIEKLNHFPGDLEVNVYHDLNDWPGSEVSLVQDTIKVTSRADVLNFSDKMRDPENTKTILVLDAYGNL